jgi:Fe-S oxidoreductase
MNLVMGRMYRPDFLTPTWQENMRRIEDCTDCGVCKSRCPYGIDIPKILKEQRIIYFEELKKEGII